MAILGSGYHLKTIFKKLLIPNLFHIFQSVDCKTRGIARETKELSYLEIVFSDSRHILKAVCHAFDWVIMTIQRIGNLNG